MPGNAHNLLTESWISTIDANGDAARHTLPGVLHALGSGRELEFSALQGHQRQAWYAFLVQLGAMATAQEGSKVKQNTSAWHSVLLKLADGNANAWHLVVDDLTQPAFFQPPVPEGNLGKFKRSTNLKDPTSACGFNPDTFDIVVSAKNFDLKVNRFGQSTETEYWAFSLLTLQTMHGYLGAGKYGVARMSSGWSSRPETALTRHIGWSSRFRRDVEVLQENRSKYLEDFNYSKHGISLAWLEPWQGKKEEILPINRLDPFFLEVCRRVRICLKHGRLLAFAGTSKVRRVDAEGHRGFIGDPWIPIRKVGKDNKPEALKVTERGFNYPIANDLLLGKNFSKPAALKVRRKDGAGVWAIFRSFARGKKGTIAGYHERHLLVPGKIVLLLGSDGQQSDLAELSRQRIDQISRLSQSALKPTLLRLRQERAGKGPIGRLNLKDLGARPWLDSFERSVDMDFFEHLFDDFAAIQEGAQARQEAHYSWNLHLYSLVKAQFDDAKLVLAPSGVHRYPALARASSFFKGRVRQILDLEPPGSSNAPYASQDQESEGPPE